MSDFVADAHEFKALQLCEKFDLPHPQKRVQKSNEPTASPKDFLFSTMLTEQASKITTANEPWVERIKLISLAIQRKKRNYFYNNVKNPELKAKHDKDAEKKKKIEEDRLARMIPKTEEVSLFFAYSGSLIPTF